MLLCDFHIRNTWSDSSVAPREVKEYLTEDYTLGILLKSAEKKVVISGQAVDAEAAG